MYKYMMSRDPEVNIRDESGRGSTLIESAILGKKVDMLGALNKKLISMLQTAAELLLST